MAAFNFDNNSLKEQIINNTNSLTLINQYDNIRHKELTEVNRR